MSFKNPENRVVRESLICALFQLMSQKPFNDIKISEIALKAGVSRMAYYRNYQSKEDLIADFWDQLFENFKSEIVEQQLSDEKAAILYFSTFRKYAFQVEQLIQAGMQNQIHCHYEIYMEEVFGKLFPYPQISELEKVYKYSFIGGGLNNVIIAWASRGMLETDEEMANIIAEIIRRSLA